MTTTIGLFRNSTDFEYLPGGRVIFEEGEPEKQMSTVKDGEVDIVVHGRPSRPSDRGEFSGKCAWSVRTAGARAVAGRIVARRGRPRRFSFLISRPAVRPPGDEDHGRTAAPPGRETLAGSATHLNRARQHPSTRSRPRRARRWEPDHTVEIRKPELDGKLDTQPLPSERDREKIPLSGKPADRQEQRADYAP